MARGYNQMQYNTNRYNADGTDFVFAETISLVEATVINAILLGLLDFMFFEDSSTQSISNKALTDTIQLADWFSARQNPQSSGWFD